MHIAEIKIIMLDRKGTNKSLIEDSMGNIGEKQQSKKTVIPRGEKILHSLTFTHHVTPCLELVQNWVKVVNSRLP